MFKSLFCIATLILLSSCSSVSTSNLKVVEHVDLSRYQGVWYEIAKYENKFQKQCLATRATYNLKGDQVEVLNECRLKDGSIDSAKGTAFTLDKNLNSKLKVSFVPFFQRWGLFSGNYWIIELDQNYQYAVVGEPERKYLWILSRDKSMDQSKINLLKNKLDEIHKYSSDKLIFSPVWED